jgi:hypothetical protein
MGDKRRENERVPILRALPGAASVVQAVTIRELGRLGAQVDSTFPLQVDSLHEFKLALGDHPVVVKGRVAHCRVSEVDQNGPVYRSGIEFVEPPEAVSRAIAEFLDGLKEERSGEE